MLLLHFIVFCYCRFDSGVLTINNNNLCTFSPKSSATILEKSSQTWNSDHHLGYSLERNARCDLSVVLTPASSQEHFILSLHKNLFKVHEIEVFFVNNMIITILVEKYVNF